MATTSGRLGRSTPAGAHGRARFLVADRGGAARRRRAARPAAAALATLLATLTLLGAAAPAAATTPTDVRTMLLGWINADRASVGLVPWRGWGALNDLALDRADRIADSHTLSHVAAGGNVGEALDASGIPWSWYGEALGMTGATLSEARRAADLRRLDGQRPAPRHPAQRRRQLRRARAWPRRPTARCGCRSSPPSPPITPRRSRSTVSLRRSGRTLTYRWRGVDPALQTLGAGLRSFDVQVRRGDRTWRLVRNDTVSTSFVLRDATRQHWYWFRVQAADRRGTLSAWTTPVRIWVP